jgi:predicted nuclease of predicted toxin-antitoxin system
MKFLANLGFSPETVAYLQERGSVILFRLRNMRPDSVNRHLQQVLDRFRLKLEKGAIITVTEGNIRVRELPFETD